MMSFKQELSVMQDNGTGYSPTVPEDTPEVPLDHVSMKAAHQALLSTQSAIGECLKKVDCALASMPTSEEIYAGLGLSDDLRATLEQDELARRAGEPMETQPVSPVPTEQDFVVATQDFSPEEMNIAGNETEPAIPEPLTEELAMPEPSPPGKRVPRGKGGKPKKTSSGKKPTPKRTSPKSKAKAKASPKAAVKKAAKKPQKKAEDSEVILKRKLHSVSRL